MHRLVDLFISLLVYLRTSVNGPFFLNYFLGARCANSATAPASAARRRPPPASPGSTAIKSAPIQRWALVSTDNFNPKNKQTNKQTNKQWILEFDSQPFPMPRIWLRSSRRLGPSDQVHVDEFYRLSRSPTSMWTLNPRAYFSMFKGCTWFLKMYIVFDLAVGLCISSFFSRFDQVLLTCASITQ